MTSGSVQFRVSRDSDEPSSGLLFSTPACHPGGDRDAGHPAISVQLLCDLRWADLCMRLQPQSWCMQETAKGGKFIWTVLDLWVLVHKNTNPGVESRETQLPSAALVPSAPAKLTTNQMAAIYWGAAVFVVPAISGTCCSSTAKFEFLACARGQKPF